MSGNSAINWTDKVWNPLTGCTRVSAGCDHCYAFSLHDKRHLAWKRGSWPTAPEQYRQPFSKVQLLPDRLLDPTRWRTPQRVFVNSMGDLFHKDVPDEFIDRVFAVMALSPQHTFMVLTKRSARMREYNSELLDDKPLPEALRLAGFRSLMAAEHRVMGVIGEMLHRQQPPAAALNRAVAIFEAKNPDSDTLVPEWPLPNVILMVSAENQEVAAERIPDLLATPAAVRGVSLEPLLGPIDLRLCGIPEPLCSIHRDGHLQWIIVGGESGAHARPCDLGWIRSIRDQCASAGVPLWVKQLGTNPIEVAMVNGDCAYGRSLDFRSRSGEDMEEWPEDLRIRELPEVSGG